MLDYSADTIIAYQGVYGSNSHRASCELFPDAKHRCFAGFSDVFDVVRNAEADYGIIPIENSYAGRVSEIHNLLNNTEIFVVGEKFLHIEHHLCAVRGGEMSDIKSVYSHPQALMQCTNFFKKSPNIQGYESINTAVAAKNIAESKDISKAALCSKLAAEKYGLKILEETVQNEDDNYTVFIVISREKLKNEEIALISNKRIITSIIFTVRDVPGGIFKCLGGFATNNINLLKLESYISVAKQGKAQFFISFIGSPDMKHVQYALEELGFFSEKLNLLGVYKADDLRFISTRQH